MATDEVPRDGRRLWNSREVAEYFGIPIGTLNQWAYRKIGPPYHRVGRHRRYRESDIERWLEAQRHAGGHDAA